MLHETISLLLISCDGSFSKTVARILLTWDLHPQHGMGNNVHVGTGFTQLDEAQHCRQRSLNWQFELEHLGGFMSDATGQLLASTGYWPQLSVVR